MEMVSKSPLADIVVIREAFNKKYFKKFITKAVQNGLKCILNTTLTNHLVLFRKQGSCQSSEENWPDHSSAHHNPPSVPRHGVSSGEIGPPLLDIGLFEAYKLF